MFMTSNLYLIGLILFISSYVYVVGKLSMNKNRINGAILPIVFLCISIYFILKPYFVENLYPSMREGILSSFFGLMSIVGFIIYIGIKYFNSKK